MIEEQSLKPCPFCGGRAFFLGETATIKCEKCGCTFIITNPLISRLEATKAWNTRIERKEQNNDGE